MSSLRESVVAAFNSWWVIIGILAASVTGFNLVRKALDLGLSSFFADVIGIYEQWVHEPIAWLAGLLMLNVPSWAIDLGVLWLFIGGIVLRSAVVARKQHIYTGRLGREFDIRDNLHRSKLPSLVFVSLNLIAWPISVVHMFRHYAVYVVTETEDRIFARIHCDRRIVLTTQALAALAVVGVWVVANYFL